MVEAAASQPATNKQTEMDSFPHASFQIRQLSSQDDQQPQHGKWLLSRSPERRVQVGEGKGGKKGFLKGQACKQVRGKKGEKDTANPRPSRGGPGQHINLVHFESKIKRLDQCRKPLPTLPLIGCEV